MALISQPRTIPKGSSRESLSQNKSIVLQNSAHTAYFYGLSVIIMCYCDSLVMLTLQRMGNQGFPTRKLQCPPPPPSFAAFCHNIILVLPSHPKACSLPCNLKYHDSVRNTHMMNDFLMNPRQTALMVNKHYSTTNLITLINVPLVVNTNGYLSNS